MAGIEKVAKRLSGYQPNPSFLRLNLGDAENSVPGNQREDYGDFPYEWAVKIADPAYSPSDEDKAEIRALLDAADPMNDKAMSWLVKSIIKHGVQEPIRGYWVANEEYIIVTEGNRRTVACNIAIKVFDARLQSVPFLVEQGKNPAAALIRQYVANQGKKEFSPIEEARVFDALISLGVDEEKISEELSTPVKKIRERLQLLTLTPAGQELVEKLDIAPTVALTAIKEAEQMTSNPMAVGTVATQILETAAEVAQTAAPEKPVKVTGTLARKVAADKKAEKQPAPAVNLEEQRVAAEQDILTALPMVDNQAVLAKAAKLLIDEQVDAESLRSIISMLSAVSSTDTEALAKAAKVLTKAI